MQLTTQEKIVFDDSNVREDSIYGVFDDGLPFKVVIVERDRAIGLLMVKSDLRIQMRTIEFEYFLSGPWSEERVDFELGQLLAVARSRFLSRERYHDTLVNRLRELLEDFNDISRFFDR